MTNLKKTVYRITCSFFNAQCCRNSISLNLAVKFTLFYQKCKNIKLEYSSSLRHIQIATSLCLNRFLSVVYFMVKLIFKPKVCGRMRGCIETIGVT